MLNPEKAELVTNGSPLGCTRHGNHMVTRRSSKTALLRDNEGGPKGLPAKHRKAIPRNVRYGSFADMELLSSRLESSALLEKRT